MLLAPTDFYLLQIAEMHAMLCDHPLARQYLTGNGIRHPGKTIAPDDPIELGGVILSGREYAHLFSIFDGSRVHEQANYGMSDKDAPTGRYFTIVNYNLIKSGHKNRFGLFQLAVPRGPPALAMYIDHYFLRDDAPECLGTVSIGLCVITAYLAGLSRITLIAGGGRGYDSRMWGYNFWPGMGFDANLVPEDNAADYPHLKSCHTVQDVFRKDRDWWRDYGSQRRMHFNLNPASGSWDRLLDRINSKL